MNSRRNGSRAELYRVAAQADQQRVAQAFGIVLRSAREQRGLSPEDVGARCGFDRSYASSLERGVCDPTLADFFRLSIVLGVAPARLLEDTMVACAGQRLGRTDVIRLREIWAVFENTLAKCPEPRLATALAFLLLDDLAKHGLALVSLPFEPQQGHGHA